MDPPCGVNVSAIPNHLPSSPDSPADDALRVPALVACGLLQVALIAMVDYATGPDLACSIFYLMPVAFGARYGGVSLGTLLALTGSVAWYLVDMAEHPATGPLPRTWNGIVHFATLALLCSM